MIQPLYSLCFTFLLITSLKTSAQKDSAFIYFDSMHNVSQKDGAVYKQVTFKKDSLWCTSLSNLTKSIKIINGSFKDSALSIQQGLFEYFYPDGSLQNAGYYVDGKQSGSWRMFNEKMQLIDSAVYVDGQAKEEAIYNYYEGGSLNRYTFESLITNQKVETEYNENGQIKFHSEFLNKTGQTVTYYPNGKVKIQTVFEKNKMKSISYFDETGEKLSDKEFERLLKMNAQNPSLPDYPGGDIAFFAYVERSIKNNPTIQNQINNLGNITMSFFLNENGKPYNIQVIDYSPADVSNALIEIIKSMQPWKMNGHKSFGPVKRIIRFV